MTFKPTDEQEIAKELAIKENILKIQSIAGGGKTSSLCYIADGLEKPSLYLTFNKSMQREAQEKFPAHVLCKTTHSLAYTPFGRTLQHKLSRPKGKYVNVAWTGKEIANYFRIKPMYFTDESFAPSSYIGMVIKQTVARFEQSANDKVGKHHIPRSEVEDAAKRYDNFDENKFKKVVLGVAKKLWEERIDSNSDVMCSHDTYLKLYQLSKPDLSKYEVIYVDEFQDSSYVLIDIIMQQVGISKVVCCGDDYQSIYQWRGAVNALSKVEAKETWLTHSFRYGQAVADVATTILQDKVEVKGAEWIDSVVGEVDTAQPHTILYRTNSGLLSDALQMIEDGEDVDIQVDLRTLVSLLKSAEALYADDLKNVKDENIIPFTTWEELKTETKYNGELKRIAEYVENGQAQEVIDTLLSYKSTGDAKITLITAHRSKGCEYENVLLSNCFPSNYNSKGVWKGLSQQEENLLYVAATRAIKTLQINDTIREFYEREDMKGNDIPVDIEMAKIEGHSSDAEINTTFKRLVGKEVHKLEAFESLVSHDDFDAVGSPYVASEPRADMANFTLQQMFEQEATEMCYEKIGGKYY